MSISGSSIYFHVPFCKRKCPYCHFYSVYPKNDLPNKYIDALILELKRASINKRPILSVYFGGGTPSLIGPENIQRILENIPNLDNCEITLETNPDDVDLNRMKLFKKAGINRISMGVQSFIEEELLILKRNHTSEKALMAIEDINSSGIENISIDLMFDLPHQTAQGFEKSLQAAIKAPIKHISLYNLTFEKDTFFTKNYEKYSPYLPSSEESAKMLETAVVAFEKSDFRRYEISAFAKEGYKSFHNIGYWTAREFFGFGPSAFSYVNGRRYKNTSDVNKYIDQINNNSSPVDFEETLPQKEKLKELLAINLRLIDGVDLDLFQKINGPLPSETFPALEKLLSNGLLEKKEKNIRLTQKGLLFYDEVAVDLI